MGLGVTWGQTTVTSVNHQHKSKSKKKMTREKAYVLGALEDLAVLVTADVPAQRCL